MKLLSLVILSLAANLCLADTSPESGLVLSSPETLKALETLGFSLTAVLTQTQTSNNFNNQDLAQVPTFKSVLENLRGELRAFNGKGSGGRPFDINYLVNPNAHFDLVGVINRMDRGYHSGDRCGELRFIYRLSYEVMDKGLPTASRLPMTVNIIFNAGKANDEASCAEVARAWQQMTSESTAQDWITKGPLSTNYFKYENLKTLEINLQAARQGAAAAGKFGGHADYLLKVYHFNSGAFAESTLENQISRDALKNNPALLKELRAWLLDPKNAKAIDDGTFELPEKFLAKNAFTVAPGGIARSQNRPYYGVFKEEDLRNVRYADLQLIKSPAGFIRRLNDSTCTGCHQTRAIGGFHFTGMDPYKKYPGNSVFLPGSAHFMGDLSRRRAIVATVADIAQSIDYSRGFSLRPQEKRSQDLIGTGLYNGWSAPCATSDDPTFKRWTCAQGLVCTKLLDISDNVGMGTCLTEQQQMGSPCEFGRVKNLGYGRDEFTRTTERKDAVKISNAMCSPQSQDPGTFTGGFLNGNIRKLSCEDGPGEAGLPPEAVCGLFPAAKPPSDGHPGFNKCTVTHNFQQCLTEYALPVGQRACDQKNPCRDDYICAESLDPKRGVCMPPYFIFQFRVDGHPKGDS
jgi:hypothetical protein